MKSNSEKNDELVRFLIDVVDDPKIYEIKDKLKKNAYYNYKYKNINKNIRVVLFIENFSTNSNCYS